MYLFYIRNLFFLIGDQFSSSTYEYCVEDEEQFKAEVIAHRSEEDLNT